MMFNRLFVLLAGLAALTAASPAAAQDGYVLGSGDRLRVITFGEDDLSGEFRVDDAGQAALPLIGPVAAAGRTPAQFQAAVEEALRGRYLRDPKVSVEVLNHRPFYILGEVNKPGAYPYGDDMTVMNAVAAAQGFTYRANARKVFIKHAGEGQERAVRLTPDLKIAPGDTLRIGERFF